MITRRDLILSSALLAGMAAARGAEAASAGSGRPRSTLRPGAAADKLASAVQEALDREEIRAVIDAYGLTLDMRDWAGHRALFLDRVEMDYSEMGVPAVETSIKDWIRGDGFAKATATQHITDARRIEIDGNEAHVFALLHAQHFMPNALGEPVQRMIGYYEKWLVRTAEDGWKIRKVRAHMGWNEGNWAIMTTMMGRSAPASG